MHEIMEEPEEEKLELDKIKQKEKISNNNA